MEYLTNRYKEVLASDKLCKKFHELGFPFAKADDKTEYKVLIGVTLYVRPTVQVLSYWCSYDNLDTLYSDCKGWVDKLNRTFQIYD